MSPKRVIFEPHIAGLCTLSHVSPPQFRRELKKFGLQHTRNAVFYCDKAVLSPARRKLKSGNSRFFVTITTLQKNSKVVIPTLFPVNLTYWSTRARPGTLPTTSWRAGQPSQHAGLKRHGPQWVPTVRRRGTAPWRVQCTLRRVFLWVTRHLAERRQCASDRGATEASEQTD